MEKPISVQKLVLILLGLLLVVGGIYIIIRTINSAGQYTFTPTTLPAENVLSFTPEGFNYYNGNAFYSTNLQSGVSKRLSPYMYLPEVSTATFGKNGALVTFNTYSPFDLIGQQIKSGTDGGGEDGEPVNEVATNISDAVWYVDFSSGKVTSVNGVIKSGKAVYITSKDQFVIYGGTTPSSQAPTYVYTPGAASAQQLSLIPNVKVVTGFFACEDLVCITITDNNNKSSVYELGSNNKFTKEFSTSSNASFLETSSNKYLLVVEGTKKDAPKETSDDIETLYKDQEDPSIDQTPVSTQLYSLQANKLLNLGSLISPETATIESDGSVAILTNGSQKNGNYYYTGKINEARSSVRLKKHISDVASQGYETVFANNEGALIKSGSNHYWISKRGSPAPTPLNKTVSYELVDKCATNDSVFDRNGGVVSVIVQSQESITKIQQCVDKQLTNPFNVHTTFEIITPRTGAVLD